MELNGKVAIVTGGAKGIGAAIVRELSRAGAHVVINYHYSTDAAQALAQETGGTLVKGDVSTPEGCATIIAAADALGGPDILVNNAGITQDGLLIRMSDASWDEIMNTNAGSAFRMSREVLASMMKKRDGQANYAASKAALIAMTRTLAHEMGRRNIRINAVAPGFIQTDMISKLKPEILDAAIKQIPLGRLGRPEDIAPLVRFLCEPSASYITGQTFIIDGGISA
jgi:3-oxoacyl-[acyl-carrier protein] reductase